MGYIPHALTAILVVLKLCAVPGIAKLSWWLVFAPSIAVLGFGFTVGVVMFLWVCIASARGKNIFR